MPIGPFQTGINYNRVVVKTFDTHAESQYAKEKGERDNLLFKKERLQAKLQIICWVLDVSSHVQ